MSLTPCLELTFSEAWRVRDQTFVPNRWLRRAFCSVQPLDAHCEQDNVNKEQGKRCGQD